MAVGIEIPGQVPVQIHTAPGQSAFPLVAPLATQSSLQLFACGGLTKLQVIAASILGGFPLSDTPNTERSRQEMNELRQHAVLAACQMAEMLLQLTDSDNNTPQEIA